MVSVSMQSVGLGRRCHSVVTMLQKVTSDLNDKNWSYSEVCTTEAETSYKMGTDKKQTPAFHRYPMNMTKCFK